MENEILKTVIIGSGPAGLTSAIYACRSGLSPVLISGADVGGQLVNTPEIENWPGRSDAPDGYSLIDSIRKHAESLGTKFMSDVVESVDFSSKIKVIKLKSGTELKAYTVIISTGAKARYLGLESENKYKGHGISACATCDGFFFRQKEVAVVGGGSAAFVDALYLTNMCKKVYLIHRREQFRAEKVMVDKLKALVDTGKVEFVLNATVDEIKGDDNKVTSIVVNQNGCKKEINVDGVFVAIGHDAATQIFKGQIDLRDDGTIVTGYDYPTQTSAKGVFAAGDCADNIYRQAITSAGEGCKAALDVEKYLLKEFE